MHRGPLSKHFRHTEILTCRKDQLNGGEFNGRALIADGRNKTGPVKIRDIKLGPSDGGVSGEQGCPEVPRSPAFSVGDTSSWSQTPQFDSSSLSNISNNSYVCHGRSPTRCIGQ